MREHRIRSIGTKVTAREYEVIAARAGTLTISEWARHTLLEAAHPHQFPFTLLAEMIALRWIIVNSHMNLAAGHMHSHDEFRSMMQQVDANRWRQAEERLAEFRTRNSSQRY